MGGSNPQQKQKSLSDYKVVIAYDFGTTYSGAAYAFTNSTPIEVFDIQNWPHKSGNFYPKVPTVSVYSRQNNLFNKRLTLSEWGHGAKKVALKPDVAKQYSIFLSQFKLHLDESLKRPPLKNGLTPVQVVADYLAMLHKHTLQELSLGFANNYDPDTFRYCLTVPALWSDKAKHLMRQAAIQAGLITPSDPPDRLTLISEPEAAAIYCEETMADQVSLKDNDRFMVCDAGGGTVDLIVFQVNYTDDGSDDSNQEVAKGMGESCGSVFLDNHYRELLEAKLGTKLMSKITQREMNGMMEYFLGTVKPEFNGVDDFFLELPRSVKLDELPLSVRDHDDEGYLEEGILKLSADELKKQVFDPVIDKVLSLIEQQYQQISGGRLDSLFLVGGFGSSKYLQQRVRKEFQGSKVNQIVCPAERTALAVVRGAVYHGINSGAIVSRISRRTYGINRNMPFDDKIDPPSLRWKHPDGKVVCQDRFHVFVEKSNELPVDQCVQDTLYIHYGTQKYVSVDLFATENSTIPRYTHDPGVHCIARMAIRIPKIPNAKKKEKIYFTVRMYFGRTEIRMEVEFSNGIKFDVKSNFDGTLKK
ncbi:hypothetical protein BDA99DRAFT_430181 [Phascolomyces articulosus]|uniref:Actin-like ATPase domain-containing protein n=1 Tax=Phascolomyces articulosus TaxID=60185 RepID=A0AAD5KBK1_9FUNG|nr:hypothetical protein BDA99DRAFT_430181 [Phascolomyces articulosus]